MNTLKYFAEKKGVRIYNASETSMIDAYERVAIETVK